MSRIIKCDRCGAEITGEIGYVSVLIRTESGELTGENIFEDMDYCPTCTHLIREFVKGIKPTREKETTEKTPTEKTPRKRGGLDVERMKELRAQGLSAIRIASEMGVTANTVYKYLNMEAT